MVAAAALAATVEPGGTVSEPSAPARALLAGRYRLESVVAAGACTTLWRAVDEVLARQIAVKVLHEPSAVPRCADAAEAITRFTSSAASVGRLAHPRIASTYDAGVDGNTPYIVTEWVDGEAVADVVARTGPLTAARAHTVAVQTAAALAYAHDNGIPHGQVDGFNVLLCADGNVKLTDFGVASALAPDPSHDGAPERRSAAGLDVRAAAAVLYLCLTGRSVNGEEPGLPAAPRKDGVLLSPQQVRAGVPRELDLVVMRTLGDARRTGPPIGDPAELVAALDSVRPPDPVVVIEDDHTVIVAEPLEAHGSRLLRLGVPALLAAVLVIAVVAAVVIGLRRPAPRHRPAGGRPAASTSTSAGAVASSGSPAGSATAASQPPARLPITAARDFDPEGSPPTEDSKRVPLAFDGDTSTSWETDRYKTAAFGQLKSGVGLVFDLGRPVTVDEVVIELAGAGTSLELRAGDAPGSVRDDFTVVATAADAGPTATLRPTDPAPHQYWLVWVTKLPPAGGGFKARLAEVAFSGQPPR